MFSSAITDLAKPQWLATLKTLKTNGGMAIRPLADELGVSYMAAKQYGEDLTRLGYLERIRTPRTAVGRPEIHYRVAAKADALFPDTGMALSLELLENSRLLFGEHAPDRLIHQHFETLRTRWTADLEPHSDPPARAGKLASLRRAYGAVCDFEATGDPAPRLIEHHHPLIPLFRQYPRSVAMDTRLIGDLLGTRVERIEIPRAGNGTARVEFLLPDITARGSN